MQHLDAEHLIESFSLPNPNDELLWEYLCTNLKKSQKIQKIKKNYWFFYSNDLKGKYYLKMIFDMRQKIENEMLFRLEVYQNSEYFASFHCIRSSSFDESSNWE